MSTERILTQFEADTSRFTAEMDAAAKSTERLSGAEAAASKETQVLDKSLGSASGKVAAYRKNIESMVLRYAGWAAAAEGLRRVIVDTTRTIKDFDAQLARVRALGGEYAQQIDKLGDAAAKLGPKFSVAPQEALVALEALAKAGVSASDILGGALEGALSLSASGMLEAGQAAEFSAAAMAQFGLAGSDMTRVADLLSAAANKAMGDVQDFGNALRFIGPVAAANNVELEEVVGTLALFAQNGILGEQAGTSLRGVLSSLTAPSGEAAKQMRALGIVLADGTNQFYDAQGRFLGLANMAGVLARATAGLTQEQRNQALGQIFGNQQLTAANILLKGGAEEVRHWTSEVDDAGISARIAADNTNSWAGEVAGLQAAWDRFILSIDKGNGVIAKAARGFTGFFRDILDGAAAASETKEEVEAFTALVQKEWETLGQKGTLVAKSTDDIVTSMRLLVRGVRELGDEQIDVEQALVMQRRAAEALDQAIWDGNKLREAAARAAIIAINEEVDARRAAITAANEQAAVSAQAAEEAEALPQTLGQRLAELRGHLEEAQRARLDLTATDTQAIAVADRQIASIEAQIAALEGQAKATKDTNTATRDRLRLMRELEKAEQGRRTAGLTPQQAEESDALHVMRQREAMAHGSAELLKRIEIAYQAEILAIRARFAVAAQQAQDEGDDFIAQSRRKANEEVLAAMRQAHDAEMALASGNARQRRELMLQHAEDRAPFLQAIRDAELQELTRSFEAQYAVMDEHGLSTAELQDELGRRIHEIKKKWAEEDMALVEDTVNRSTELNIEAAQQIIGAFSALSSAIVQASAASSDAQIADINKRIEAAKREGREVEALEAEKAAAEEDSRRRAAHAARTAATIQAMAALAVAMAEAVKTASSGGDPYTVAARIAAALAAVIAATATIQGSLGSIPGYARGGEVDASWGPRIRRSNGDNVLATLQSDEVVLSRQSRRNAERMFGAGVWGALGVPGFSGSVDWIRALARAGGGTVAAQPVDTRHQARMLGALAGIGSLHEQRRQTELLEELNRTRRMNPRLR